MKIRKTIKNRRSTKPTLPNSDKFRKHIRRWLARYDYKKPTARRIAKMNKRQRRYWSVEEFTEWGTDITFEFDAIPDDWDSAVDNILDICDNYRLETSIGWDETTIKQQKSFTLMISDYNCQKLGKAFVEIVANQINREVFHGSIEQITLNYDALWETN